MTIQLKCGAVLGHSECVTRGVKLSLTRPVERAVFVGVQSDHLADGPHIVPQHDALSLHHEEVCVR